MKSIFENVIKNGGYDLKDLLDKIDLYHIDGKLSDDDRDELIIMARQHANASNSADLFKKIKELDERVQALEKNYTDSYNGEYLEYVVGKWYYRDNKCTFEGEKYICIAPQGTACVWSPKEHPSYWELVE